MPRYNVGDFVVIRSDLSKNRPYPGETGIDPGVSHQMIALRGQIARIKRYAAGTYRIDLDDGKCYWTDSMFRAPDDGSPCFQESDMPIEVLLGMR